MAQPAHAASYISTEAFQHFSCWKIRFQFNSLQAQWIVCVCAESATSKGNMNWMTLWNNNIKTDHIPENSNNEQRERMEKKTSRNVRNVGICLISIIVHRARFCRYFSFKTMVLMIFIHFNHFDSLSLQFHIELLLVYIWRYRRSPTAIALHVLRKPLFTILHWERIHLHHSISYGIHASFRGILQC